MPVVRKWRSSVFRLMACLLSACGACGVYAEGVLAEDRMSVAVVEFDTKGNVEIQDAGAIIAEWMITALAKTGKYALKERVLLKKVLDEQRLGASALVDDKTLAARAGKLYGVKAIVTGSVLRWGNITSVTARLVETDTGAILKTADVKAGDTQSIPGRIDDLARALAGMERENLPADRPDGSADGAAGRKGYVGMQIQSVQDEAAAKDHGFRNAEEWRAHLKLAGEKGAFVVGVVQGGPAESAGFRVGDVILTCNGQEVGSPVDIANCTTRTPPGALIRMTVARDGKERELTIRVGEMPESTLGFLGIRAEDVTDDSFAKARGFANAAAMRERLKVPIEKGVYVANVFGGGAAERAGVRVGDTIIEYDGLEVLNSLNLDMLVRQTEAGKRVRIVVIRGGVRQECFATAEK